MATSPADILCGIVTAALVLSLCKCAASRSPPQLDPCSKAVFKQGRLHAYHRCRASLASPDASLPVTILADTNRDGKVDIRGSDLRGKGTWTRQRGALILANIVDTDRRCSSLISSGTPDEDLDKCHDASDNVLRNEEFLAPLRTRPNRRLSSAAVGTLSVRDDDAAAARVRIFHKTLDGWVFVTPDYTFCAQELRRGLKLGIDARDVRRPGIWDGRVTVTITVTDGIAVAKDAVALRVAPLLTHHNGQKLSRVLSKAAVDSKDPLFAFNSQLERAMRDARVKHNLIQINYTQAGADDNATRHDVWVQDYFESGYMSIPGPRRPVGLHVLIRSAQSQRATGRFVFASLRSNTTGAVQVLAKGNSTDSLGNLETVPPHSHGNKSFPAGRIVMGSWNGVKPQINPFLVAQEEQSPIELDTTWLLVGHTDEFLQFLPVPEEPGWVMARADPLAGLSILEQAQKDGFGSSQAYSRRWMPGIPKCEPNITIDKMLGLKDFIKTQHRCDEMIRKNVDMIKRETGVTEKHVVRLPVLYYPPEMIPNNRKCHVAGMRQHRSLQGAHGPRRPALARQGWGSHEAQVSSVFPNSINGLVLDASNVIAPNPFGPMVGGKDVMREAVATAYGSRGYQVGFIDDWRSHYIFTGDVHCGTNTIREFGEWW